MFNLDKTLLKRIETFLSSSAPQPVPAEGNFNNFCFLCGGGVADGCSRSCNNGCDGGCSAACGDNCSAACRDNCQVSCDDNCSSGCYGN